MNQQETTQSPTKPRRKARTTLLTLGASAATFGLALAPSIAFAAPGIPADGLAAIESGDYLAGFQDEYLDLVDATTAYEHVRHLAVDIGPRVAGTDAEDEALAYVEGLLDSYGYETETEIYDVRVSNFADVVPSRDDVDGQGSWQFRPAANALFTGPDVPVDAEVVDIADGSELDTEDVAGNFVLVNWVADQPTRNALISEIAALDPAGIIVTQTAENAAIPNLQEVPAEARNIIVASIGTFQGERIRELLGSGDLSLSITTERSRATSSNVIGVLPAVGDDDGTAPIVYIGAHIDSVVGSPGASDNASGVGVMLAAAEIIAQYPLDVEIRIGAWGAEETGIVGSRYHADQLTQDEIDRTIGAWNMDMVGTSFPGTAEQPTDFYGLSVNPDNADNAVLNYASDVTEHADYGELNRGYVGRSDHQSFHDVGIDAAVFSWMYWSAETSIVLEPTYHRPSDTIDFISAERLELATEFVGGSAFRAALNTISVTVSAADGSASANTPVAMSCTGDEGWREVGTTDESGVVTTLAPHVECDFVAAGTNGTAGSALDVPIQGDTEVALELAVQPVPTTPGESTTPVETPTETPGESTPTTTAVPSPTDTAAPAAGAADEDALAKTGDDFMLGMTVLALLLAGAGAVMVARRVRQSSETGSSVE